MNVEHVETATDLERCNADEKTGKSPEIPNDNCKFEEGRNKNGISLSDLDMWK